jgi:PhnB protein
MKLNPYLNFNGNAIDAFKFYQSILGGEMNVMKMDSAPGLDHLTDAEKEMALHVSIPIGNGQFLMASDCLESLGQKLEFGNNNYISLSPDSREEADRIFSGLSEGGVVEMPMEDMFWGDYFGSFKDKFGVCWMINFENVPVGVEKSEHSNQMS